MHAGTEKHLSVVFQKHEKEETCSFEVCNVEFVISINFDKLKLKKTKKLTNSSFMFCSAHS